MIKMSLNSCYALLSKKQTSQNHGIRRVMNFDPGLEQLRGDKATFESAQELSHIFSYNLRPKKLFLVWVDFPALCLKVAKC